MELSPELLGICVNAGSVLANSMVSDLWNATREKFADFFSGRPGGSAQIARLDRDHQAIAAATGEQQEILLEKTAASWVIRLQDVLEDDGTAGDELADLVKCLNSSGANSRDMTTNVGVRQQAGQGGVNIYSGRDTRFGS